MIRIKHQQAVFLAALLLCLPSAVPAADSESDRLLFLLEYIGADYGAAVEDGAIVNAFEYREMADFSRILVEQFDVLRRNGAPEAVHDDLLRLQELIRRLRPRSEILELTGELTMTLLLELDAVSYPLTTPDPVHGAQLFAENCAACHGPSGAGDGFAAAGQKPPATSFRDARMNILSPHQVYGAITFGVDGTAMPSYLDALPPRYLWDIAFHVLTLREDFDPGPSQPELRLTLPELVSQSNDALVARLNREGFGVETSDIDYFRQHPPEPDLPADESSPIRLALQLQDAFTGVANDVFPSVVSVTSFVRDTKGKAPKESDETWRIAGDEANLYPGFRRLRSGSGFFVTEDGYLLSCYHVVSLPGGETAEVIDVELPNGRHVLSRLVGAEPTINLAVLKLEIVSEHRPPRLRPARIGDSDALQVGHWAIAVGDPVGPARTYAVGTLAARPRRQCYQEQLTGTLMQSSLSIHPESYGGPLVNIHGEIVGMNVPPPGEIDPEAMRRARSSEYALPINLAMNIYEALKISETRKSPWLGISVLELAAVHRRKNSTGESPPLPRTGVYIDDVFDPSPAARAGIRVGDSLVAIDGNRLFSVLDFQKWLYLSGIGRSVRLEIFREQETLEKKATIEERPQSATTR